MAAGMVDITGSRPASVTDKNGLHHFVPLSAFELTGSTQHSRPGGSIKHTVLSDCATQVGEAIDLTARLRPADRPFWLPLGSCAPLPKGI